MKTETLMWVGAAAVAGAIGFGVGVRFGREKQQNYHEVAGTKWDRLQRWIEEGFPEDSRDRIRSRDELDNLLYELERAGMKDEQVAVALLYEKLLAIIETQNPPSEQALVWP